MSKNAILARKRLKEIFDENGGSWSVVAQILNINRGTLYHVYRGDRKPSNKVMAALGLPFEHVSVLPCAKCGQLHEFRTRCPGAPTKYAPHPVMRVSKIKRILNSPYKDS